MAKEHHCPKCGAQPCVASTSKIHTCGVCASIWEEDLSAPVAAPAAAKPATPAPPAPAPATAPPKPTAPVTTPPKPSPAAAPGTETQAAGAAPKPAAIPTPPAAAAAPVPRPTVAPSGPSTSGAPSASPAAPGSVKRLADMLPGAKVPRCPACQSDGVAQPSDYAMVQGRLVLVDSQTYRGHRWYADTGELLATPSAPAPAPPSPAPAPRTNPAT